MRMRMVVGMIGGGRRRGRRGQGDGVEVGWWEVGQRLRVDQAAQRGVRRDGGGRWRWRERGEHDGGQWVMRVVVVVVVLVVR